MKEGGGKHRHDQQMPAFFELLAQFDTDECATDAQQLTERRDQGAQRPGHAAGGGRTRKRERPSTAQRRAISIPATSPAMAATAATTPIDCHGLPWT